MTVPSRLSAAAALAFSPAAVVIAGAAAIAIVIFPWRVAEPRVYPGIDSNLTYIATTQSAHVDLNGDGAVLVTPSAGSARADVVTTPDAFTTTFTTTILQDKIAQSPASAA